MILLERAKKEGTPLIEDGKAIFVWQGKTTPTLSGDFSDWQAVEMTQSAPDVWTYELTLPDDAYIEYTFIIDEKRFADPLNTRTVDNGMDELNHYFSMPAYQHSAYRERDTIQGTITAHVIEDQHGIIGQQRNLWLYQPAVDEPVPLVLVYDGKQYRELANIIEVIENLVEAGKMRPVALALHDNAGAERMTEYHCSESLITAVYHLILPLAKAHLNLIDIEQNTGAYGVMGSSMGGLMATYTSLRLPHIFGHVISQSGAFLSFIPQDTLIDVIIKQWDDIPPIKFWLDAGQFEWLLQSNQQLYATMNNLGWDVTYNQFNSGHNYTAWCNAFTKALPLIFPSK